MPDDEEIRIYGRRLELPAHEHNEATFSAECGLDDLYVGFAEKPSLWQRFKAWLRRR